MNTARHSTDAPASSGAVAPAIALTATPGGEETRASTARRRPPRRGRTWWLIVPIAALGIAGGFYWSHRGGVAGEAMAYRFATVERGDIEAAVSSTGRLGAVTTVQVGTQVSGQVEAIHVDFNDRVTKGQLIARIDPTLQQQAVRDAEAGIMRSRAELEQAERNFQRSERLWRDQLIPEHDFNSNQYAVAIARANITSAQVVLERARQNLAYTSIHAPIDGVIIERNVDVGQTVAASLSAPQLFLIANDLSQMQILASVDESDIGLISEGQPVRFTVQAHGNRTFTGMVRQVRLQSTTVENVVNYTAVIEVGNEEGKLLPGMTATVELLTGSDSAALLVPNAALRFRPPESAVQRAEGATATGPAERRQGATGPTRGGAGTRGGASTLDARGGMQGNAGTLWHVGADGELARLRIRTGITDGRSTAVEGEGVREGMQVIIGTATAGAVTASPSPFQPPAQQGRRRSPGGF